MKKYRCITLRVNWYIFFTLKRNVSTEKWLGKSTFVWWHSGVRFGGSSKTFHINTLKHECHEMSESRLLKLKEMKKRKFPLYALNCGLGHRRISALPGFHKAVPSHNYSILSRSRVHPLGNAHTFSLTNPHYILLSCTILLASQISELLFYKQSFTVSIHLFRGLHTERLPAHSPT